MVGMHKANLHNIFSSLCLTSMVYPFAKPLDLIKSGLSMQKNKWVFVPGHYFFWCFDYFYVWCM